ncbi:MAG TPA: hypothetical protein VF928_00930 [Usitatibacteraceae bacterium]
MHGLGAVKNGVTNSKTPALARLSGQKCLKHRANAGVSISDSQIQERPKMMRSRCSNRLSRTIEMIAISAQIPIGGRKWIACSYFRLTARLTVE